MNSPIDAQALRLDYLQWKPEEKRWRSQVEKEGPTIEEVLKTDIFSKPGIHIYIFPEAAKVERLWNEGGALDPLCSKLSRKFQIPPFFWSKAGWDANGFFKSRADTMSSENAIHSYHSSFRFLLKQVKLVTRRGPTRSWTGTRVLQDGGEEIKYAWEFYGLHSIWKELSGPQHGGNSYSQVLLCFDFVDDMRSQTVKAFEASNGDQIAASPFGVHEIFLEPLIEQYDTALWGFRAPVRNYEQVCPPDTQGCDIFGVDLKSQRRLKLTGETPKRLDMLSKRYENMHELERHIIHAMETLKVASTTLEAMIQDHKIFVNSLSRQEAIETSIAEDNTERSLHFFSDFLNNLRSRAEAFEKRLQNEIRLTFGVVAADDNATLLKQIHAQMKLSAQVESLKNQNSSLTTTVSVLTLLFLPGSFISGFFGTNFFTITSDSHTPPQWRYVGELWIFFAVTGPITIIAMAIWYYAPRKESQLSAATDYKLEPIDDAVYY